MTYPPQPVVFEPLYHAKPWGGRRLTQLLGKALPGTAAIGEAWELVSLPGYESRVARGPLAGLGLGELLRDWGTALVGAAALVDGRFPLLIKFLDACDNLSVQVHPKPAPDDPTGARGGVKHECWYVLHADPGAKLYVGLRPGVGPVDVARVANTPAMVDILQEWAGQPGQCYYLPSGTLHALGAGLVVAEVQTPSDITYRAYDWNRVDAAGRPRDLHVTESLANIRYDVTSDIVRPTPRPVSNALGSATRVVACERFVLDFVRCAAMAPGAVSPGPMRIWIVLEGHGRLVYTRGVEQYPCVFARGDTVLIPADCSQTRLELSAPAAWLEVTIP
jgi:mannose-6-phosphate isomerase